MLTVLLAVVLSAGFIVAGMVSAAVVQTFTLSVAHNAAVTDQTGKVTTENIVVNRHGHAVYELTGDSARHPKCTQANSCLQVWLAVEVGSARSWHKQTAIRGKLGTWRRNGFIQVTLNGHPLYTFSNDHRAHAATGEGIVSFNGTWHVLPGPATSSAHGTPTTTSPAGSTTSSTATTSAGTTSSSATSTASSATTSSSTSSTTTTTRCLYPPCY